MPLFRRMQWNWTYVPRGLCYLLHRPALKRADRITDLQRVAAQNFVPARVFLTERIFRWHVKQHLSSEDSVNSVSLLYLKKFKRMILYISPSV